MSVPPSPGGGAGVREAAPRVAIPSGLNAADVALVAVAALQNAGMGATECFTATKHVLSDQHIDITVANAQKILNLLKDKASLYGWSHTISKVRDLAGDEMDLLTQYNQLMLDNLKHHANHS
eukprot:2880297-Ditylum_brightwellii.AAC.1